MREPSSTAAAGIPSSRRVKSRVTRLLKSRPGFSNSATRATVGRTSQVRAATPRIAPAAPSNPPPNWVIVVSISFNGRSVIQSKHATAFLARRVCCMVPEGLIGEEAKLNDELTALKNSEDISDVAMHETMKDVQRLSELVKNLMPYYQFAKPHEKEQIVRVMFAELSLSENTLQYKCKKGFECFEDRFKAICDPTGNRTPISAVKGPRPSR